MHVIANIFSYEPVFKPENTFSKISTKLQLNILNDVVISP